MEFEDFKAGVKAEDDRNNKVFNKLKAKYPDIYSITDAINFYVPKGWVQQVCSLSEVLRFSGVRVLQVKQKFGGLRFYVDNYDLPLNYPKPIPFSTVREAVSSYESLSYSFCEECGVPEASVTKGGYVQSLCPTCIIKLSEIYN